MAGFSFSHRGGPCVVWYIRKGTRILDLLIAPPDAFQASYNAASRFLRIGEQELILGGTGNAYVFDAGAWQTLPFTKLSEANFPSRNDLAKCTSPTEVARKILGEQAELPNGREEKGVT